MSTSPDQSRFTACLLGEATPAEQSALDAALQTDVLLREEAASTGRTAQRLADALKREVPVSLTPIQRQNILGHDTRRPLLTARKRLGSGWLTPALATAGIAAAVTLALYLLTDSHSKRPDSTLDVGIPAVAIKPGPLPAKSGSRPALPPPALGRDSPSDFTAMPDIAFPAHQIQNENQQAMKATPPDIAIDPAPLDPGEPDTREYSSPAPSAPVKNRPVR